MRTVNLAAAIAALRASNSISQEVAAQGIRGEGGDYNGGSSAGMVNWENKLETPFGAPRTQIRKRPTLSEIKRLLKKYGAAGGYAFNRGIIGFLGR